MLTFFAVENLRRRLRSVNLTASRSRWKLWFEIYLPELADEILAHNFGFGQHAGGQLGATVAPNCRHTAITASSHDRRVQSEIHADHKGAQARARQVSFHRCSQSSLGSYAGTRQPACQGDGYH